MKLPAAEQERFLAVMRHYGFDPDEIEAAKESYRRDPAAGRQTYAALWREVDPARNADLAEGVNERVRTNFERGLR